MHAASGFFSWSMELLAFASRLLAPIINVRPSVIPFHTPATPSAWYSTATYYYYYCYHY